MSLDRIQVSIKTQSGYFPTYATDGASGADLAYNGAEVRVAVGQTVLLTTGIRLEIPHGFEGQIRSRSGLARRGIVVVNSPGTIDNDYRGEIKILLQNIGNAVLTVLPGDRIAQLVICPVVQAIFHHVDELPLTDRGEDGFGSTGF
jgi:dUTP pyrophosphatase